MTTGSLTDPALLARVEGLDLRARMLVEGLMSGRHRSPFRGYSVEFVEHRRYVQGDDLRHIDWKVFGRSDKHYVKQYEQESNLLVMLVVDASESMGYRSNPAGLTKYEYASVIAASLAYLTLQNADAVGMVRFDDRPGRLLKASNNPAQFHTIVHELEQPPRGAKTDVGGVLETLTELLHRRHLVVLLSDLFDSARQIVRGLRRLRHRRHEPIVMHVMDHAELEFPFKQWTRFRGLEGATPLLTEPRVIRERYLAVVREFMDRIRQACNDQRTDYQVFDTSGPLDDALANYLATRAERHR